MNGDASLVCSGELFTDASGLTKKGTKDCVQDAVGLGLKPEMLLAQYEVGGVKGEIEACSAGGQQGCYISGDYAAANTVNLASKVVAGYKVAGVDGAVNMPDASQVELGSSFALRWSKYRCNCDTKLYTVHIWRGSKLCYNCKLSLYEPSRKFRNRP